MDLSGASRSVLEGGLRLACRGCALADGVTHTGLTWCRGPERPV